MQRWVPISCLNTAPAYLRASPAYLYTALAYLGAALPRLICGTMIIKLNSAKLKLELGLSLAKLVNCAQAM